MVLHRSVSFCLKTPDQYRYSPVQLALDHSPTPKKRQTGNAEGYCRHRLGNNIERPRVVEAAVTVKKLRTTSPGTLASQKNLQLIITIGQSAQNIYGGAKATPKLVAAIEKHISSGVSEGCVRGKGEVLLGKRRMRGTSRLNAVKQVDIGNVAIPILESQSLASRKQQRINSLGKRPQILPLKIRQA